MDLPIFLSRDRPLESDAYAQLRKAILDGRLRAGDKVPPTRELAKALGVSRNTVLRAYERLTVDGLLEGRGAGGTFVQDGLTLAAPRRAPTGTPLRPRASFPARAAEGSGAAVSAPRYDFRAGAPDVALFPYDEWRRLLAREFSRGPRRVAYGPPEGDPQARASVARHISLSRGVRAGADDVLLTAGAQQAFDLVARVLLEPGSCVCVENPGYPPVRRLLASYGARIVPVRVDAEGLVVGRLPTRAALVYVTPSHQFPLGPPMSLRRRLALLEWSERAGAAIVEDDYDSEIRFDGRPLESLQGLDERGRVIYVGTFSKLLLPSLRLGFLVAPASLQPALREAKRLADGHAPPEAQRALAAMIDRGLLARHARRVLREYRARRDALAQAADQHLSRFGAFFTPRFGLHGSFIFEDQRCSVASLIRNARKRGIAMDGLDGCYAGRARQGILLGIGASPAHRIEPGIRELAETLERMR